MGDSPNCTNQGAFPTPGRVEPSIPFDPDQPLWPMGVVSLALRSELGLDLDPTEVDPHFVAFIDHYGDFVLEHQGQHRCIATASRLYDHREIELWQHFRDPVTSKTTLTFCDGYLSITTSVKNRGKQLYVPNWGNHDPIEVVLPLASVGHGMVGVEHRNGADFTFRAFEITPEGYEPVPVDQLGRRLGTPDAPSLRYGWNDDRC